MSSLSSHFQKEPRVQLDLTQLNLLSANDPEFKNQVLRLLFTQTQEVAASLTQDMADHEWVAIADTAHRFKASVNLVYKPAYFHFMELEKVARTTADVKSIHHLVAQGISMLTELSTCIQRELAN